VPSFKKNLILIGQAIDKEFIVTHDKNTCFLIVEKGQGKVVMIKIGSSKLYKLQIEMILNIIPKKTWLNPTNQYAFFGISTNNNNLQMWHECFGHVHHGTILITMKNEMVTNIQFTK
jgi:hypothetical protein